MSKVFYKVEYSIAEAKVVRYLTGDDDASVSDVLDVIGLCEGTTDIRLDSVQEISPKLVREMGLDAPEPEPKTQCSGSGIVKATLADNAVTGGMSSIDVQALVRNLRRQRLEQELEKAKEAYASVCTIIANSVGKGDRATLDKCIERRKKLYNEIIRLDKLING